ncbi:MAG: hypothetical protein M3O28_14080 [Actinomycetota bacterium]|nr:hypothetical protein [Actinomycetota bacterium]
MTLIVSRYRRRASIAAIVAVGATAVLGLTTRNSVSTAVPVPPPEPGNSVVGWGSDLPSSGVLDRIPARLRDGSSLVVRISATKSDAAVVTSDGQLIAWGADLDQMRVPSPPTGMRYVDVSVGAGFDLALTDRGTLVSWGRASSTYAHFPPPPAGQAYTEIHAGDQQAVALLSGGTAVVAAGQVDHGLNMLCGTCVTVANGPPSGVNHGFEGVRAASVNQGQYRDQVIVDTNGTARMAVQPPYAAVNFGDHEPPPEYGRYPHLSLPGERFTALAVGGGGAAAAQILGLTDKGLVYSWGVGLPVPPTLSGVEQVAAGLGYALALRTDGSIVGWGSNSAGQLNAPPGRYTAVAATDTFALAVAVPTPAVAVTAPVSTSVPVGGSVAFTTSASGEPAPRVQWQQCNFGGSSCVAIPGATQQTFGASTVSSTYTLAGVVASQNNLRFRAVFTNSSGSAATAQAVLTVTQVPTVLVQPLNQVVSVGGSVTYSAVASGSPDLPRVVWQRCTGNGLCANTTGGVTTVSYGAAGTTSTYTVSGVQVADSGSKYRATYTNSQGSTASTAASLFVSAAPSMVAQPVNQSVQTGGTLVLTATATGNPSPTAVWESCPASPVGCVPTAGGTVTTSYGANGVTSTLTVTNMTAGISYWRVVYTNASGAVASDLVLAKTI